MKTSELTGAQLDYWTARAEGIPAEQLSIRQVQRSTDCHMVHRPAPTRTFPKPGDRVRRYSTDWAQGGPLIEKHSLDLQKIAECLDIWTACDGENLYEKGRTPLQAICRAVVRAAFGDEVEEVAVNE